MAALNTLVVLLSVSTMLGEARVNNRTNITGEGRSLSEHHVRTKRLVFNRPVDVKYFLHTRENRGAPTVLEGSTPDVSGTTYSSNRGTKFIIHGLWSKGDDKWIVDMANALLQREDLNVFAVDWREGASPGLTGANYRRARRNCRVVGKSVGEFVGRLGQSPSLTHIIGHSLGAHAAGFAGKAARSGGLTVGRISGLDPAGPGFRSVGASGRLDKSDAIFVDVIHTETFVLGIRKAIGHVDFYPNEGWLQPGCARAPIVGQSCSHSRAYKFFNESINSECDFLAYRCRDWDTFNYNHGKCDMCPGGTPDGACSVMGYHSINYPDSQGSMYLVTSMNPTPHCSKAASLSIKKSARKGKAKEEVTESGQCVQSLRASMRQEIRDYVHSIADIQDMGMQEDFCSMYSDIETAVANITSPVPNCGPEDAPVVLKYITDATYEAVKSWAEDKCSIGTGGGALTLPSAMLTIGLQLMAALTVWGSTRN